MSVNAEVQYLDLDRMLRAARRQLVVVVTAVVVCLLIGLAYLTVAPRQYTSTATVIVDEDPARISLSTDDQGRPTSNAQDEALIQNQVLILESRRLGTRVIADLQLTSKAEFSPDPTATWRQLSSRLRVDRVGLSHVIEISYTGPTPDLAQAIVTGLADAYLKDQVASRYDSALRAGSWLQSQMSSLKDKSATADAAVQTFKEQHGLLSSNGQLITDKELADVANQLTEARAATMRAKSRYETFKAIGVTDVLTTGIAESLENETIKALRASYLDLARREREMVAVVGEKHELVNQLRAELAQTEKLIEDEVSSSLVNTKTEYDLALSEQTALETRLSDVSSQSSSSNSVLVQLRELEREATILADQYTATLAQYQRTLEQQSFPLTGAQIVSSASLPTTPSQPQNLLVLGLAGFIGLFSGTLGGLVREYREQYFRTPDDLREYLSLPFLGMAPRVRGGARRRTVSYRGRLRGHLGDSAKFTTVSEPGLLTYVLDNPNSRFAQTMQSCALAASFAKSDRTSRAIGIVSIAPGEGKSVIAANFASLLAAQGMRTLLIDGDIRRPSLSRSLTKPDSAGLLDIMLTGRGLEECIQAISGTQKLSILPVGSQSSNVNMPGVIASPLFENVVIESTAIFDRVIVDLPPIGPVVEARALATTLDGFILVIEWGQTPRRVVKAVMEAEQLIAAKCLGVVLNKVDENKMRRYGSDYGGNDYYGIPKRLQRSNRRGQGPARAPAAQSNARAANN